MTAENRQRNSQAEWRLVQAAWREAEILLEAGQPRGALTRYYYAAFHAACAALISEGKEPATHAGVRTQFSLLFIRIGRLPRELARDLASLQQQREYADSERDLEIDEEQATWAREEAQRVYSQIEKWLAENGWLSIDNATGSVEYLAVRNRESRLQGRA